MDSILNFDGELSIESFDQVVAAMYASGPCQAEANRVLQEFRQHSEAWKRVDAILERSSFPQSKHIALSILEDLIKSKWNALPQEQRTGIKNFVVALVIKSSSSDELMEKNKLFLNKLNVVLVQILKRDWPHNWPTFIEEIVGSSKTNLTLCENNMVILKLLSEEIFDYSAEEMVSVKIVTLKNKLKSEFFQIYQLCHEVVEKATKTSLITATINTLIRFINWIPHEYIFETNIIEVLTSRFLETPIFRTVLKCFTEISGLDIDPKYSRSIIFLYKATVSGISRLIPVTIDISQKWASASDQNQQFIQNVALFLTTIFSTKLKCLEAEIRSDPSFEEALIFGHKYLLNISEVDDRELFKICLEYWLKFTGDLNLEVKMESLSRDSVLNLNGALQQQNQTLPNSSDPERISIYKRILGFLRNVIIGAMVKPEEVLVVEVDGVVIREVLKESEIIFLYKSMREVLIHLTDLDMFDMESIMKKKLEKFMTPGSPFNRTELSKLCWAIGSISGAMSVDAEKNFLVFVIRNLLVLCEKKTGKDDKAVVASNIMYVVGQYPRFLRAHWRFLKTVVNKLFEFMHEKHEGIQDMACDTLIKIAQKCKRFFVIQQPQEPSPYIDIILDNIEDITSELSQQQLQTFYEALGYIISSQTNKNIQEDLIKKLMSLTNSSWESLIVRIKQSPSVLNSSNEVETIIKILRINISVSNSVKKGYFVQLKIIYLDLLTLYTAVSDIINNEITVRGTTVAVLNSLIIKRLRAIRKDIIKLFNSFMLNNPEAHELLGVATTMILEVIALDYSERHNSIKESEVLVLIATIVKTFENGGASLIPGLMNTVFQCTLELINKNFEDYPDIRIAFYHLLDAMINNCFDSVLEFPPEKFSLFFNSLVWASKHTLRDVSDVGLLSIIALLEKFASCPNTVRNKFYKVYYINLLQDILFIITNPFHKPGFETQCVIFLHLINLVEYNMISEPLFDESQFNTNIVNNKVYVKAMITDIVQQSLPHVQLPQAEQFIGGLFQNSANLTKFTDHIRDFLIASKEVAGDEDLRLYSQVTPVPNNEINTIIPKDFENNPLNHSMHNSSLKVGEAAGAEDMAS